MIDEARCGKIEGMTMGYRVVFMNSSKHLSAQLCSIICCAILMVCAGCIPQATKNSLSQHTGESGSTIPRSNPPHYPNTAGNIVAPPGNPAGNAAGSPPIINGTENSSGGWPAGR